MRTNVPPRTAPVRTWIAGSPPRRDPWSPRGSRAAFRALPSREGPVRRVPGRTPVLGPAVSQCTLPLVLAVGIADRSLDFVDDRPLASRSWASAGRTRQRVPRRASCFAAEVRGRPAARPRVEHRQRDDPAVVPRSRRALPATHSVEMWNPTARMGGAPLDRTLYMRHIGIRPHDRRLGRQRRPTAVVEHGANPGLVSHFRQAGVAPRSLPACSPSRRRRRPGVPHPRGSRFRGRRVRRAGHAHRHQGDPHRRERHADRASQPKQVDEFVNTWSVEGFYEEGVAPAELGWGTHERSGCRPARTCTRAGPRNQICIARPGMETWVRSWVPLGGEIRGMVIRHGEAFNAAATSPLRDADAAPTPVYRPTVHYAYCPPTWRSPACSSCGCAAGEGSAPAHPQRRDLSGRGPARRAAHGPRLHRLVDRVADSPSTTARCRPGRDHAAGRRVGRRRRPLDDGEPLQPACECPTVAMAKVLGVGRPLPRHLLQRCRRLGPTRCSAVPTCSPNGASTGSTPSGPPATWQFTNFLVRSTRPAGTLPGGRATVAHRRDWVARQPRCPPARRSCTVPGDELVAPPAPYVGRAPELLAFARTPRPPGRGVLHFSTRPSHTWSPPPCARPP